MKEMIRMGLPYILVALLMLGSVRSDDAVTCSAQPWDSGPWGAALVEWALAASSDSERQGRVMSLPPAPGYYVIDRVDRPPPPPQHMGPPPPPGPGGPQNLGPTPLPGLGGPQHLGPTPPPGPGGPQHLGQPPLQGLAGPKAYTEWEPPSDPGKILNRPSQPYVEKPFRPSPSYQPQNQQQYQPQQSSQQQYQPQPSNQQHSQHQYQPQPPNQQLQHSQYQPPYNPHRGPGSLPPVDRVDEPPRKQVSETDLYLLSAIEKLVYRVDLMEKRLRKMEENVHYLVAGVDQKPEPCVTNFSRVGENCYHFSMDPVDWKSANLHCRKLRANLLELDSDDERRKMFAAMLGDKKIRGMDVWTGGLNPGLLWIWSHSARPVLSNGTAADSHSASNVTIVGTGRCLALVHDPATKTYVYRGQDCALRHRYICEKQEDKAKLSNEIERVARGLKTSARQARLLLADRHRDQQ